MATGDLTTLSDVRSHLGIESTDADAMLEGLITSSSAWFKRQVDRDITSATYTHTFDGDGSRRLLLRQYPVTSITSVSVDGAAIPARAGYTSFNTGYVLRDDGLDLVGYTFTTGTQNVVVVYVAGYATTPTDVAQAVKEHVALRYRDRGREGLASMSGGGESVGFAPLGGTLAYINGVLDSYRRVAAG